MRSWIFKHAIQLGLALALLLSCLGHVLGYWELKPLEALERRIYDTRLTLSMPGGRDERIVIVDIDEKSLAAIGRWPWNRDVLARLMDQLFDRYHTAVVGFDIVFAEPDESSGAALLDRLARGPLKHNAAFLEERRRLAESLDFDRRFAESLRDRATVLGYYFSGDTTHNAGDLVRPAFTRQALSGIYFRPYVASGYGANLPVLARNASNAGHFNPAVDEDGVVRHVSMLLEYQGNYYTPLALEVVRSYLARKLNETVELQPLVPEAFGGERFDNLIGLQLAGLQIPLDKHARALIPYRGKQGSFPYVSAIDVLQGKVDPNVLNDRIVLIGTTAPGLKDLRVTPMDGVYAGVEMHANLVAGILDQSIPSTPDYMMGVEALALVVTAAIMLLLLLRFSPLIALTGSLAWIALLVWVNFYLWEVHRLAVSLGPLLCLSLALYGVMTVYGYFFETRHKRELSNLFGRYVPPELVSKMSENPESYTMDGQSRELTVLFSDVRGFTTISESMDPKELTHLMNEFLTVLSRIIRQDYLGTIDKYMGDCVMAFWGAPFNDPEHPRHAVHAGLAMVKAMAELGPALRQKGWPAIEIGVGINSGRVTVGDMGSQYRKAYTAMGDAVNLASRLEGLTRRYGVYILVGESTKQAVDDVVFREIDRVRVKGKSEAVTIYEPLGLVGQVAKADVDEDALFQRALKLYRQQDWDMAELQLLNLQRELPRPLYELYLERIAYWRHTPPEAGWDGAHDFDSK